VSERVSDGKMMDGGYRTYRLSGCEDVIVEFDPSMKANSRYISKVESE
jgi:hypothetical protein